MKPRIVKAHDSKETLTSERCFVAENYSADDISVAQARVKPGITTVSHHLEGVNEIYMIVSGEGQVDIGELPSTKVNAGDLVVIPAGTSQRISNIGENDLIVYCVCTPKFTSQSYHDHETKSKRS